MYTKAKKVSPSSVAAHIVHFTSSKTLHRGEGCASYVRSGTRMSLCDCCPYQNEAGGERMVVPKPDPMKASTG